MLYFYTNNQTKKFLALIIANDILEADKKFNTKFNTKIDKTPYIGVQVKTNASAVLPCFSITNKKDNK